jgi:hypothetical protein
MIQTTLVAVLVALIRAAPLLGTSLLTARITAIAMAAITMRADEEDDVTALPHACPLAQCAIAVNVRRCRHRDPAGLGLDSGGLVVSG